VSRSLADSAALVLFFDDEFPKNQEGFGNPAVCSIDWSLDLPANELVTSLESSVVSTR
jgi:hypothetical protein